VEPPHEPPLTFDAREIDALVDLGKLPREASAIAPRATLSTPQLTRELDLLLVLLAAGTGLAGVVFFFAYNWADMHRFAKLGLIQALTLGALGAHVALRARSSLFSQVALFAASVFVGVFFATFGQIYQTGADAWQLFAAWAALVTPWVLLSRSQPHWLLWLALVHAAAWLLEAQLLMPRYDLRPEYVSSALGALMLGMLVARDLHVARHAPGWLSHPWGRTALVLGVTVQAVGGFTSAIVLDELVGPAALGVLFYLASAGLLAWWIWRNGRDVPTLAIVGLGAISAGFVLIARAVLEAMELGGLFVLGAYVVVASTALVAWLRHLDSDAPTTREHDHD
jgi:uncharacterized membrane protein